MVLRLLKAEDLKALTDIYDQEGGKIGKNIITGIVAEDEEGIQGFWMVEQMLHAGPLWISPKYRGKQLWKDLHSQMNSLGEKGTGYYIFSPSEKMDKIYKKLGLEKMNWTVWKKEI